MKRFHKLGLFLLKFNAVIFLLLLGSYSFLFNDTINGVGNQIISFIGLSPIISTNTTIYICPVALANCAYNGDGGQAATPSDSGSILAAQSKATPWATIAHASSVFQNAWLLAHLTFQLADSSTSCYTDSEVVFNPSVIGGEKYQVFEIGWSQVGGPVAYTDIYPNAYIELKGNITTPSNVNWTGATVPCAGAVSGARTAVRFLNTNGVVHGINFKYFDANNVDNGAVQATRSLMYFDNLTLTGSGGTGSYLTNVSYESEGLYGPNMNATEGGVIYCNLFSHCTTHTPAGNFSDAVTNNSFTGIEVESNEGSHVTIWGTTTQSYLGTAAYTVYSANSFGFIVATEANAVGASAITLNGANIRFLSVGQGGTILNGCGGGNNTCTLTSFKTHSAVSQGGTISDNLGTQGTSADTVTGFGCIQYTVFSTPSGFGCGASTTRSNGFMSIGTKFTATGCSLGATTGGATAGTIVSGTTGTCTLVITMNGATGLTAPTGWACAANDRTTPSNLISQTASSATTCTISGATVSGDLISFSSEGY